MKTYLAACFLAASAALPAGAQDSALTQVPATSTKIYDKPMIVVPNIFDVLPDDSNSRVYITNGTLETDGSDHRTARVDAPEAIVETMTCIGDAPYVIRNTLWFSEKDYQDVSQGGQVSHLSEMHEQFRSTFQQALGDLTAQQTAAAQNGTPPLGLIQYENKIREYYQALANDWDSRRGMTIFAYTTLTAVGALMPDHCVAAPKP